MRFWDTDKDKRLRLRFVLQGSACKEQYVAEMRPYVWVGFPSYLLTVQSAKSRLTHLIPKAALLLSLRPGWGSRVILHYR